MKNRDKKYATNIRNKYGISLNEYQAILAFQQNRCALCGVDVARLPKRPCVDHCHRTGTVRGILCAGCNVALGQAEKHGTGAFSYYTQFPPTREMREREENPDGPHPL